MSRQLLFVFVLGCAVLLGVAAFEPYPTATVRGEQRATAGDLDLVTQRFGASQNAMVVTGSTMYVGVGPRVLRFEHEAERVPELEMIRETGRSAALHGSVTGIALARGLVYATTTEGDLYAIEDTGAELAVAAHVPAPAAGPAAVAAVSDGLLATR
jgi:hypothetical protein